MKPTPNHSITRPMLALVAAFSIGTVLTHAAPAGALGNFGPTGIELAAQPDGSMSDHREPGGMDARAAKISDKNVVRSLLGGAKPVSISWRLLTCGN